VRQLLTESVFLASLGGVAGLLVGFLGIKLFQVLASEFSPRVQDIALDVPVVIFTLAVSIATGILAGLAPAIQGSRADLNESLKESARGSGRSQGRARAMFVVAEVALALLLLTGAGLMVSSLVRLSQVKPGFDPAKVLTMQIDLSGPRYTQVAEMRDIEIRAPVPKV
jgi:putative ABC transport system permease protein